jgi:acyl-CoA dehydrogenase
MQFAFTEEQELLRREARGALADGGWAREEVAELGFLDQAVLLEEAGRALVGESFFDASRPFNERLAALSLEAVGIAAKALDMGVEYAKTREQFGKPIAEHQAVAFRLADMATRVDAARLLVHRAARKLDGGGEVTKEAAMAKLFASETAMWCTWAAVQTLGGWGYSREYPVEKWMRDAKLEEIEEGTSDIQRVVISRRLLT